MNPFHFLVKLGGAPWGVLAFVALQPAARAEGPAVLVEAVTQWAGERDRWAFTQSVKEFDGETVKQERWETYDPSRPFAQRWVLVAIDGRRPTVDERTAWDKRKNKKRRREARPLVEYFDFERATLLEQTAQSLRYAVPLRSSTNWFFSVEKVNLAITVNKVARAVERIDATIDEPFKVALGLARVLDFDLELHLQPRGPDKKGGPAGAEPNGDVHAVIHKFGQRVEYRWHEFKRVTPHADWTKLNAVE